MHPASWPAMAGLCARKILCPDWDHESFLVGLVEELEARTQENTLSRAVEKACDATAMGDSSPETWFRILRAAEDVALMTKKTSEPRRFKNCVCQCQLVATGTQTMAG